LRRSTLLILLCLGLAALGAIIISTYSALAWRYTIGTVGIRRGIEQKAITPPAQSCISNAQNITVSPRFCWRLPFSIKGFRWARGLDVELSEGFKNRVLSIAEGDEDVQKLLNEGYNIGDIRIAHVKLVVQENGQITMEVDRVILLLVKGDSRAFVEIDLKAEKVTRIAIVNVTLIEKSTESIKP